MVDLSHRVERYEILGELGRGGMGAVYLARQIDLDRLVALKALLTLGGTDPTLAERFLREARTAGKLTHPNIVIVHEFFEAGGVPYIAMEYVNGGSLRPLIHELAPAQAMGVLEGVLAGLAHAERHGIVHRDLKPENLMVTAEGRIKIADFGIAKAINQTGLGASLTATGATLGTPLYMAPEQAMALDLGPGTDLYSLGVIAYEIFAGGPPFSDTDAPVAMLLHQVNDPVPDPRKRRPELDDQLAAWILRLLEKSPDDRPAGSAAAWDELEPIVVRLLGPLWRRDAPLRAAPEGQQHPTPRPLTPAPFSSEPPAVSPASGEYETYMPPPPVMPDTDDGVPSIGAAPPAPIATPAVPPAPEKPAPPACTAPLAEPPAPITPTPHAPASTPPLAEPAAPATPGPASPAPMPETSPASPAFGLVDLEAPTVAPAPPPTPTPQPSPAVPSPAGRPARPYLIAWIAAIGLIFAALGFAVSRAGGQETRTPAEPSRVANADFELTLPASWQRASARRALPGIDLSSPLIIGSGRASIAAGYVKSDNPTLLPPTLLARLGARPPNPERVALGGRQALRYRDLRPRGIDTALTIYVSPSTAGIATIVCATPINRARDCDQAASSLRLLRGRALSVEPDARYARALNRAMARLDRARLREFDALNHAKTPAGQARAAGRLADNYRLASAAVDRLEPPAIARETHARLAAELRAASTAHRRLASAARALNRRAYHRAAPAARAADNAARAALESLQILGYRVR